MLKKQLTRMTCVPALALVMLAGAGSTGLAAGKSVAYIPGFFGHPFYNLIGKGIQDEATKRGWTYTTQGSNQDFSAAVQTPIVTSICSQHPDVLVIAPTDAVAMRGPIEKCMAGGVAVVLVDTSLKNTDGVVSAIASDNLAGGKLAADYIGKALDGKGLVAVQSGSPNIVTQAARAKGAFDEFATAFPGIKTLEIQYYDNENAAQTGTKSTLIGNPDVAAIFNTTSACVGPSRSIETSPGKKPLLVCFDSSKAVTELLKNGKVGALVLQPAEMEGRLAVQYAADYLDGKKDKIERSIVLHPVIVPTDKANDPESAQYYYQ